MKPLQVIARSITRPFGRLSQVFSRSSPRRSSELAALESQFYQDADRDRERVWNRQFSNSICSGRG